MIYPSKRSSIPYKKVIMKRMHPPSSRDFLMIEIVAKSGLEALGYIRA